MLPMREGEVIPRGIASLEQRTFVGTGEANGGGEEERCFLQRPNYGDASANFVEWSGSSAVPGTGKPPPPISFHTVVPTCTDSAARAEDPWQFDSSESFGTSGGIDGEEARGSAPVTKEEPVERLKIRVRADNVFLAISGVLSTPSRALATVAAIHHVWSTFCSSLHRRVTSDNDWQLDML